MPAIGVELTQRGEERASADHGLADRQLLARLVGAVEDHLQEIRRARIAGGADIDSRADLQVGLASPGGQDRSADRARTGFRTSFRPASGDSRSSSARCRRARRPRRGGTGQAATSRRPRGRARRSGRGSGRRGRTRSGRGSRSRRSGGSAFWAADRPALRITGRRASAARSVTAAGSTSRSSSARAGAALARAMAAGNADASASAACARRHGFPDRRNVPCSAPQASQRLRRR